MTRKRKTDKDLVVSAAGATAPARRSGTTRPRGQRATELVAPTESNVSEPEIIPQLEAVVIVDTPSREEVAKLAYSYWEARGCQGGCPEEDWIRAEMELRSHVNAATA